MNMIFTESDLKEFIKHRLFGNYLDIAFFIKHQDEKIKKMEKHAVDLNRRIKMRESMKSTIPSHVASNNKKLIGALDNLRQLNRALQLRKEVLLYLATTSPEQWEVLKLELRGGDKT